MTKSQNSFIKKQKEQRKRKKKKEKEERKKERRENNNKGADLQTMMAYVDENGNIVETPPKPPARKIVKDSIPKKEDSAE